MPVYAVSAVWIGVVGTVVGALIGFLTAWLADRRGRAERTAERSRAERKEAYAALYTSAEESFQGFQRLSESQSPSEEDRQAAYHFYDHNVVPRYRMLKIIGRREVVGRAKEMKDALNDIGHAMKDPPLASMPRKGSPKLKEPRKRFRRARDEFIDAARFDLEPTLAPLEEHAPKAI